MTQCETKEILLWRIPSHIGMRENERANSAAKSTLNPTPDKFKIPYTDLKSKIDKFLHAKWQQRRNNNIHNKLYQTKPTLEEWKSDFRKSKRDQVTLYRLRSGHTRLTLLSSNKNNNQCLICQTTYAVKHIFIEWRAFFLIRKWFFNVNSLSDLFENVNMDDILSFFVVLLFGFYDLSTFVGYLKPNPFLYK